MKRLFITLFFTLMLTIAFFGMAEAQSIAQQHRGLVKEHARKRPVNPVAGTTAPSTPPAKSDEEEPTVDKTGKRPPLVDAEDKAKADADKKAKDEAAAKEKQAKEDAEKGILARDTVETAEGKQKYEVVERNGNYVVMAKDAGCSGSDCLTREMKLTETKADVAASKEGEIPKLKQLAIVAINKVYGGVPASKTKEPAKPEAKLTAEERALKNKKDSCRLNDDGDYFANDEAQAECIKTKLADLIKSGKTANDKQINALQAVLQELYTKDLMEGKKDSEFVKLVFEGISNLNQKIASGGIDGAEKRLYDRLVDVQATGHIKALETKNAAIQAQFQKGQALVASGNPAAADTIFQSLAQPQAEYKKLANDTLGTIKDVAKYQDQVLDIKTSVTDLDVTLAKFKSNIAKAIVSNNGKSSTPTVRGKFGFSLENSAAEAAGSSSTATKLLNAEADFDRNIANQKIRGMINDDFQGTSPTLRPDAVIGFGRTALDQNATNNVMFVNNQNLTAQQNNMAQNGNSNGSIRSAIQRRN